MSIRLRIRSLVQRVSWEWDWEKHDLLWGSRNLKIAAASSSGVKFIRTSNLSSRSFASEVIQSAFASTLWLGIGKHKDDIYRSHHDSFASQPTSSNGHERGFLQRSGPMSVRRLTNRSSLYTSLPRVAATGRTSIIYADIEP